MGWSWDDFQSLPAEYVDLLIEWIQERERKIEHAHREARRG